MKTFLGRSERPLRIDPWGRRSRLPRPASRLASGGLLALLLLIPGCGGGGGGGTPTGPPPPQSGLTFSATGSGAGISLASAAGSQGTTLALAVQSSGIQDLYGVAFHLVYPYSVMHFTAAAQGTVLSGGAVATSFQVVESPPGTLVVGLSRLGAVPGTSAAGALMTLQFTAVANGNGALSFANNQAGDSAGNVLGVNWNAGTVQSTLSAASSAPLR